MFELYKNSDISLHLQLANKLREHISQNLKFGDKLPSELKLKEELSISRDTIRKAYDILEREGLIKRVQGSGIFVNLHKYHQLSWNLKSFSFYSNLNEEFVRKLILKEITFFNDRECLHLIRLRGVIKENKTIYLTYEDSYVNLDGKDGLCNYDYEQNSLYDILFNTYKIEPHDSSYEVSAILANEYLAQIFSIEKNVPLVEVVQDLFDVNGNFIEHVTITYTQNSQLKLISNASEKRR